MPLFIFVSGRFSHIHDKTKYKKGILKMLETYMVFQFVRSVLTIIRGGEMTIYYLIIPQWTLWYLIALIYWRLIIYYIPTNWLNYRKLTLFVCFSISLLSGFIPVGYPFVVQRTLAFLPFFMLGYYSIYFDVRAYINKISPFLATIVLCTAFCLLYFTMNFNLRFVHECTLPYWTDNNLYTIYRFVARCIFIPSTIVLGVMVMRLVQTNKTLSKWGRITLFIYVYHSFAIKEFFVPLIYRNILPQNELLLIAYSIIIIIGLIYLSRFKLFNILLNPISYWKNR